MTGRDRGSRPRAGARPGAVTSAPDPVSGAPETAGPQPAPAPEPRRRPPTPVATVVERLAVLLSAGVAPASAWRHVAEVESHPAVSALTAFVGDAAAAGTPVSVALLRALERRPFGRSPTGARHEHGWRQVACAWRVAEQSGAPLARCLRTFVHALRAADAARHEVEVALSGPRAAARIVLALPAVGVLFSLGMGVDAGGVLVGTPLGWACLLGGAGLVAAARAWNARLVRSATPAGPVPGLRLELLSVAVAGGGSWQAGLQVVRGAVEECLPGEAEGDDGRDVLELSRRAGAPASELLRAAAAESRLDATTRVRSAAARLGSTLMLPLGVCVLPAFLLVGVVPLVAALVSSTAEVL